MSLARFLEPDWSWAHTSLNSRPLVAFETMLTLSATYLVAITVLCFLMKTCRQSKPFWVKPFALAHNFFMAAYSFYALLGTVSIIWENWAATGYDLVVPFCDASRSLAPGTDWWLYTFYLSKYLEYIDSLFLVLKGKSLVPPENSQMFLHVFHHSTTASIVWSTWLHPISIFWIGPVTNAFVHTIMYGYYFLVECGLVSNSFGGKYITPIQLVQFVVCMAAVLYEMVYYRSCGSNIYTIVWVLSAYMIFFLLFVKVWQDKQRIRHAQRQKQAVTKKTH